MLLIISYRLTFHILQVCKNFVTYNWSLTHLGTIQTKVFFLAKTNTVVSSILNLGFVNVKTVTP
jgi:hypothetical protein